MVITSGVFVGTLRHRRKTTVPHAFSTPLFMMLLDIDRLPALMRTSWLTSLNRWNWASFHDRDHLGDPARPLRERLVADAAGSGIDLPDGPIFLLTHLRYLGYCFNPVSFFYVFDRTGRLALMLAEVSNTFGGVHNYWLRPGDASTTFRATVEKSLYVSPFMPPELEYRFAVTQPGERLAVHIEALQSGRRIFDSTLSLARKPWTAREIRTQLVRHPMMTAAVTAGTSMRRSMRSISGPEMRD